MAEVSPSYNTVWRICPTRELLSADTSKRDCATAVNDVFPSPRFASHRTLLGDAVNTGLHNKSQRRVLSHVRFRVYRRD
jgi:hypothetical protein